MTHAGHAWAPIGTPGRCLEGVTPGSAGIFSALSYFVAETPIMFDNGNDVSVDIDSDEKYSCMSIIYVMNILIQVHTFLKSLLFSH